MQKSFFFKNLALPKRKKINGVGVRIKEANARKTLIDRVNISKNIVASKFLDFKIQKESMDNFLKKSLYSNHLLHLGKYKHRESGTRYINKVLYTLSKKNRKKFWKKYKISSSLKKKESVFRKIYYNKLKLSGRFRLKYSNRIHYCFFKKINFLKKKNNNFLNKKSVPVTSIISLINIISDCKEFKNKKINMLGSNININLINTDYTNFLEENLIKIGNIYKFKKKKKKFVTSPVKK